MPGLGFHSGWPCSPASQPAHWDCKNQPTLTLLFVFNDMSECFAPWLSFDMQASTLHVSAGNEVATLEVLPGLSL